MHKNQNQYQSTPQLQKNYLNSGNEQYANQYTNTMQQQDYSKGKQRVPANPNQQYASSQGSQSVQQPQQPNQNYFPQAQNTQQGGLNYAQSGTNSFQQQQLQQQNQQGQPQFTEQDDFGYDYQGQNQPLDHTFSEDSNVENSQVMYPSENKDNSMNTNQKQTKQNTPYYEMERGSQRGQNNNNDDRANLEKSNAKKKRTLAIITLDVGGGNSDVIQVMEGDDLNVLAKNFCIKHNLDDDCIQYIIKNIQMQLDKRKAKKKEKVADQGNAPQTNASSTNTQQQTQQTKPQLQQQQQQPQFYQPQPSPINKNIQTSSVNNSSKDNSIFRKSSESPKFPGLQQSQQGSLQNNFNLNQQQQYQQGQLKQSGGFNQKHFNHQAMIEEQNPKKKRPQQPSFGQTQFFDSNSPQKSKMVYDQINEEDYEDQSISVIGQSANISMPDENYEYQTTNKYSVKQQSKNQTQNPQFEKEQQQQMQAKNNFLSPPQNNKMSAQQFSSPQSNGGGSGMGQQFNNSNNTTHAGLQNQRSPNSTFPNSNMQTGNKKNNNNSSINSNIYNYQEDQEEFVDDGEGAENLTPQQQLAKELLEDRQAILDYEEFNPNQKKMQGGIVKSSLQQPQQQFQQQQNQQFGASLSQSQRPQTQQINTAQQQQGFRQYPINQMGNQLQPSQKPPQFRQSQEQESHEPEIDQEGQLDHPNLGTNFTEEDLTQHDYDDQQNFEDDHYQQKQQFGQEEQDPSKESRKKIIEQISQKLNIESKKTQGGVQQNSLQQQQQQQTNKARQPSGQVTGNNNSHQKQASKGKGSNLQSQLEAKKEQFFNSYYSQKNLTGQQSTKNLKEQEEHDDLDNYFAREDLNQNNQGGQQSPIPVNKHRATQSKEQQFESPQRHIRKSYSNNNLQQYATVDGQVEEKSGAQQSYEQWQKILNQRLINGQKVNLKVKRVPGSSNTPTTSTNPIQGKVFQIQNNQPSTPTNLKKSQALANNQNIGSNTSISPRNLSKNKSATQLNNIASTSMTNFHQNHHQALSQTQLTPHQKLYIQGMEQMERRKRMFDDNQEKSKEREIQGTTFQPSISPQSRNMKLQDGVKLEDYLLLEGRKNKERKAIAALVKDEENNQECKFKPQVSVVSQKIVELQSQNDSNYSSIHDRLYFQGVSDLQSKEDWGAQQFQKYYPFNPDLGVNKDRKVPEKTQKDFTNRLINEKQTKEAKLLVQRQKENEFVDKQTGQKLFHPKINKDEVYSKVSKRVELQDQLLEEELKGRSVSPMNSKKGRDVQPPRIGQLKWDELLRSNRQPDYYEPKKLLNDNKGRSVTPRNMKTVGSEFEETNYIPLSSRGATNVSANQEIENILNQSSLRNKKITIKPSKSKDKLQTIPTINLSRKQLSNMPSSYYHASNVNNTKLIKNTSQIINPNSYIQPQGAQGGTPLNQTNFSTGMRSKSQINLNPNQTQLQLSAISQFDNTKVFNDHKLSEKIIKLFEEFDSDGDGKINQLNIDISTTDPEILEIIQNVLFEIDEKNLTLNKNQFTQLLCSHNLIIPLKRYFSDKEGEVCDEDMTDYDIIRSTIQAMNYQNNTYMENSQFNNPNVSTNAFSKQQQQSQIQQQQQQQKQSQMSQQPFDNYYEDQQQFQYPQHQIIKNNSSSTNNYNNNMNNQMQYQSNYNNSNQQQQSYNSNNINNNLYPNQITNNIINSLNQSNRNNPNLSKKTSKNN